MWPLNLAEEARVLLISPGKRATVPQAIRPCSRHSADLRRSRGALWRRNLGIHCGALLASRYFGLHRPPAQKSGVKDPGLRDQFQTNTNKGAAWPATEGREDRRGMARTSVDLPKDVSRCECRRIAFGQNGQSPPLARPQRREISGPSQLRSSCPQFRRPTLYRSQKLTQRNQSWTSPSDSSGYRGGVIPTCSEKPSHGSIEPDQIWPRRFRRILLPTAA
jgi:hypothetical protein